MQASSLPQGACMIRWIVLKFGGTSVSTRERWETIAAVARSRIHEGFRPVVVCSALTGVSNLLEALPDRAIQGEHEPLLDDVESRHRILAAEMGVDAESLLGAYFAELRRLALGISLVRDAGPRIRARVLAMGELMSTTLGAAFLREGGLSVSWTDARELLEAARDKSSNGGRRYLNAACSADADPALQTQLAASPGDALITQGFIARDAEGDTVLLGRGGSDTSAAYFAARLQAERLEIWTDVPGMFTANPRQVGAARLLRHLGYEEAQEIATTGAKVLHPRCIEPVRRHRIPLHVKCTTAPDLAGTVIGPEIEEGAARVKAISARNGLTLVSMETLGMWQQVGFLADVFATFKRHGLSIDSVATSDSNVTVSLDPSANALDRASMLALIDDLSSTCTAKVIGPCAAISLVGRNIRSILHRLAPALEVFEEQRVYLLTQAASDLNLTFVMDQAHADVLVRKLHELLFGDVSADAVFGPSWVELQGPAEQALDAPASWWRGKADRLVAAAREAGTPLYVYDQESLEDAAAALRALPVDRVFYAVKANWNEDILRLFEKAGLGFECVSPGEIAHVRALFPDLPGNRILFTPNFAPAIEYVRGFEAGAHVTLDNLYPLKQWPEIFSGREIFVRVDPGQGDGHHKHVKTAGAYSKFGIPVDELAELAELAAKNGTRIVGLHAHVGSGIRTAERWMETATFLVAQADRHFPDVRVLDLGGGLGIVERPGKQQPLDIEAVGSHLAQVKAAHPKYELWLEPGRYLVARAGVLLARVTQLKQKDEQAYVGIDAGMNSLIRPALYDAFHEIANLSKLGEPAALIADVVGPICETGDVLGHARPLPETSEGDVILIATAGAYGRSMSSQYNLRQPAAERVLPRKD